MISILSILVVGIIGYLFYVKRKRANATVKYSRTNQSYDNPAYSAEPDDRAMLYTDVPENPVSSFLPPNDEDTSGYLDVKPENVDFISNESNI